MKTLESERTKWLVVIFCRSQEHAEAVQADLPWPAVVARAADREFPRRTVEVGRMRDSQRIAAVCWLACLAIVALLVLARWLF